MYEGLKDNIFKAQRMYFLSQKLKNRVMPCMKGFSMVVLNKYIMMAKSVDLKLTGRELLNRIVE